ncbi:MAG TPA: hypothetical protein DEB70_09430 [Planctomycetaceae bacterium]|nr:hypothetical protein [Planctomycetaceae bacterium]
MLIVFFAGCYSDRLPEEIDHLGVPRVSALAVEAIPLVTLRPTETVKIPLRINRNNNEGPIDVSLSKLPSGVKATFEKQIPQGKSELEIELSGNQSLGDQQRNETVTIALSMAQSSVEQSFDIDLPVVSRPSFGAMPPVFLQPGDTVNLRVPVERNGFAESFTLEPIEYTQGALCRLPSEPIEDNNIKVLVAASEEASEGTQTQKIKTIIFGREVSVPLTLVVTNHPFRMEEMVYAAVLPGQQKKIDIIFERDSLESLSRTLTGGLQALTGVDLAPAKFNGPIVLTADSQPLGVTVEPAYLEEGALKCALVVNTTEEAPPGVYSIPLVATAEHLNTSGLLVIRIQDPGNKPSLLPEAVVSSMAKTVRYRRGGLQGRGTEKSKDLLAALYGGSEQSKKSVMTALAWLASKQGQDGSWKSLAVAENLAPYMSEGPHEFPATPAGGNSESTTALALLPFLAEGVTHEPESATAVWLEDYPEVVRKGLIWLGSSRPQADPLGGGPVEVDLRGLISGVVAGCETSFLSSDRVLKKNAVYALKSLVDRQTKEGSWQRTPSETVETVLPTLRSLLAMHVAQSCGVKPSVATLKRADVFLESAACGAPEIPRSRFGRAAAGPPDPLATAAGLLLLQYEEEPHDSPAMVDGSHFLSGFAPPLEGNSFAQSADFLLLSSEVLRNIEGEQFDTWYAKVTAFLLKTQEQAEEEQGSWAPALFAGESDRLQVTAKAILCLQLPYRYLPLYRSE